MQTARRLLWALGEMPTAILILAALAMASASGTLLTQNMRTEDYTTLVGPFWQAVFSWMGVMDLYRAPWFLAMGALLAVSVCVCLWRNGRTIWRMTKTPAKPPLTLDTWPVRVAIQKQQQKLLEKALAAHGLKKIKGGKNGAYYRCGTLSRLAYFALHGGVLVLCLAGGVTGFAGFRGQMNLAEGETYNKVWQTTANGFVARELPFSLRNESFSVDYYTSGMPSQFVTDLTVLEHGQPVLNHTLEVNKPLHWRGYTLYQADFGDGGTQVKVRVRDVRHGTLLPNVLTGRVYDTLKNPETGYSFELRDFRLQTVESLPLGPQGAPKPTNLGPSLDYILRGPDITPMALRVFVEKPWLMGLGDGQGNYTLTFLGLNSKTNEGWAWVAKMLDQTSAQKSAGMATWQEALGRVASVPLAKMPEPERLRLGLATLTAAQTLAETQIPYILVVDEYNHRAYSGVLVAYDPGALLFWLGGLLLTLGAAGMLYAPFARVWVVPKAGQLLVYGQSAHTHKLAFLKAKEFGT